MRALLRALDPVEDVANLQGEDELSIVTRPIEGRARDKLVRHLHDTLALAREWSRLVAADSNGSSGREPDPVTTISSARSSGCCRQQAKVPHLRPRTVRSSRGRRLRTRRLGGAPCQGRAPAERAPDLRRSPPLCLASLLEDDLEPAEEHLDDLRRAILEAERSEPEPGEVLTECLERQEYRRAREIIQVHELGDRARAEYQQAVSVKRSTLKTELEELALQVEDAFLLGQLRDDADTEDVGPRPHVQRP